MALPVPQWISTVAFGSSLAICVAVVAPQLILAQPAVTVEPGPLAAASNEEIIAVPDGAIDMNHWQETATPVSPYIPGKTRKGK